MILEHVKVSQIGNPELAQTVEKLHRLTDDAYELYDQNDAAIVRLLEKTIRLSKQEKEWYIYFDALYYMLYQCTRNENYKALVQYAEIYYQDSALYMDRELPNYPGTDMAYLNTYIYELIFFAYSSYYQIDDAKMDAFMKQYEENALKYGKTYIYYNSEMRLGELYREIERTEHGRRNFEKYEHELQSCYICAHEPYFAYYFLKGQRDQAEALMHRILHRQIPKQHLWCYKYCEKADPIDMYACRLHECLHLGRVEDFHYFYEKYWSRQPRESWRGKEDLWDRPLHMYLSAISGYFETLDTALQDAGKNIRNRNVCNTIDTMDFALQWHCYFALLDRSGVHEAALPELADHLPQMPEEAEGRPETSSQGQVSVLAVSRYMEELADDCGMKFAAARKKFDYMLIKNAYLECAGLKEA